MKLTKDQRFTAYCIMLAEIGGPANESRFCHLVFKLFGLGNAGEVPEWIGNWYWDSGPQSMSINRVLRFFPELESKKPECGWPNKASGKGLMLRKKWLQQCIIETHP